MAGSERKRFTSKSSPDRADLVEVGRVVGTFGLRGAIKVAPSTDFPERFREGARLSLLSEWYTIADSKWHKGQARLFLEGVSSVEQAQRFVGAVVYASAAERPAPREREYYVADLIGLEVVTDEGKSLGRLDEVIHAPANDVFRVGDLLIPAVDRFIRSIDLNAKRIVVELLPGMEK